MENKITEGKEKKLGFLGKKEEKEKEASGKEMSLEASYIY